MFRLHENAREKIIKLLFNPAVNHQQARATLGMRRYYECKFTKEGIVEKGKAQISVVVKNLAAESNNIVTNNLQHSQSADEESHKLGQEIL